MEFLRKILALFAPPPEPVAPSPLYSDDEFLEVVARLARQRTLAEQAAASPPAGAAPLAQPGRAAA